LQFSPEFEISPPIAITGMIGTVGAVMRSMKIILRYQFGLAVTGAPQPVSKRQQTLRQHATKRALARTFCTLARN